MKRFHGRRKNVFIVVFPLHRSLENLSHDFFLFFRSQSYKGLKRRRSSSARIFSRGYRVSKLVSSTKRNHERHVGQRKSRENVSQSSDGSPVTHLDLTELRGDKSSSYSRSSISVRCSPNDRNFFKREGICLSKDSLESSLLFKGTRGRSIYPLFLSLSFSFSFFRNSNDVVGTFPRAQLLLEYFSPN